MEHCGDLDCCYSVCIVQGFQVRKAFKYLSEKRSDLPRSLFQNHFLLFLENGKYLENIRITKFIQNYKT